MTGWRNWAGTAEAQPRRVLSPVDVDQVVAAVQRARERRETVKMPGTGHSFTDIAVAEDTMLRPDRLRGLVAVDREAMTATVLAGTPLHELNATLARLGLSLHNMGDIADQTAAGATSTGTHGAGGLAASLSAQLSGLEIVTGTGEVLRADGSTHGDVLDVARVGLGALGILTSLTFRVEPLFALEAHERPVRWGDVLGSYDQLVADHHHVDLYWFPHTDAVLVKTNDRLAETDEARPLGRLRSWVDDELLANVVLGRVAALGARAPRLVPRLNAGIAGLLPERRFGDEAHRVLTSRRGVVFREMEYAVPYEAGMAALAEVRRTIEERGHRVGLPVEVRAVPADDVPLSTAYARRSVYVAVHAHVRAEHTAYFRDVESVLRDHGGRPHWGKLHTCTAEDLAPRYPRWSDFQAMRDRLDPDRVFANAYLRRVLGE